MILESSSTRLFERQQGESAAADLSRIEMLEDTGEISASDRILRSVESILQEN